MNLRYAVRIKSCEGEISDDQKIEIGEVSTVLAQEGC